MINQTPYQNNCLFKKFGMQLQKNTIKNPKKAIIKIGEYKKSVSTSCGLKNWTRYRSNVNFVQSAL